MNAKVLQTLEFDKVLQRVAGFTAFSVGREAVLALTPSPDLEQVKLRQQLTAEAARLMELQPSAAITGAHDIRSFAEKAALAGMLEPAELLEVESTLSGARRLKGTIGRLSAQVPRLLDVSRGLADLPQVAEEIKTAINPQGEVTDAASPVLAGIRREERVSHDRLVQKLNTIVQSPTAREALQEPLVTQRDGRYVIPVKADMRGRLAGIVHDVSSSGATLWIEPLAVVELGNRWRELQAEERHEVERVLRHLSALVGEYADEIRTTIAALAELDLHMAAARYGLSVSAGLPLEADQREWLVEAPSELRLYEARHPLLSGEVVPIDLAIGGDYQVVLITGPNTGGKTVALKTAGLLTLMAQSGLPVLAGPNSQVPVFDQVFADIGDEQSIEQSLSTFSSHMRNIIAILEEVTQNSLVLLDELAAGTDPVEGAALAQAIIEQLLEAGCLAVATTHHGELKVFAHNTSGVTNASVEFDTETLAPTYHLTIGLPGRSNALAIAKRLGMNEDVLSRAGQVVEPERAEFEKLLADIQRQRDEADSARRAEQIARREAEEVRERLEKRMDELETQRAELTTAARRDVEREVEDVRETLRRARKRLSDAEERALAEARAEIEQAEEAVESLRSREEPRIKRKPAVVPPPDPAVISAGDLVYLDGLDQPGEVVKPLDERGELEILLGSLRTRVRPGQIARVEKPSGSRGGGVSIEMRPAPTEASSEIHLRGDRVETALPKLERFLEDAHRAGYPSVRVVHGKGTGTMRQVVRETLSNNPLVRSFTTAPSNEGGEGVTVAELAV
ncbi:MAG TPA: endonuclease MutS2 [Dehalococcoidia bacterium]|nr:endonuclease MutS2 [Dehalococcoidia bacterium]